MEMCCASSIGSFETALNTSCLAYSWKEFSEAEKQRHAIFLAAYNNAPTKTKLAGHTLVTPNNSEAHD